ncbi:MAG: IS1380 family transposase [Planctomycetes bacterium]|nr:IS1380 family transposase [Planctomycetota bacterium]
MTLLWRAPNRCELHLRGIPDPVPRPGHSNRAQLGHSCQAPRGGECFEDFQRLREDPGLSEMIGHGIPSPEAARKFLYQFHEEEKIEEAKQRRRGEEIAYIPAESEALVGLGWVNRGLVQELGRRCPDQRIATVDQDATIIESRKQEALRTYEGERGYQPMLAVWAELNVVLADEFRDGNVPAMMEPLTVAKRAFAALPETVTTYYYRGDSACHESDLINWLRNEKRTEGPRGRIGFAISARMSEPLHKAIEKVPEAAWEPYGAAHPVEIRECAEVSFVPGEKSEHKDTQPLRYLAIRIRQRQESLFADGSKVKHFAVVTNIREWKAGRLIEWHREKAGTIEGVHDVVKNELAAGVMPSKYFGTNAAWLRLAVIAHNVMTALKRLALPAELLTARPKRLRFLIFNTPGRLVHHARRLVLRLATTAARLAEWLAALRMLPIRV